LTLDGTKSWQAASDVPEDGLPFRRILVVDDDETDRRAVRRCLHQAGVSATLDEAASAAETLERIAAASYDCVLVDYYLPDATELSLVHRIRVAAPDLPIVMFTGRGDEDIAVELMKAGVADYIPKASLKPERLAAALRHVVALARATGAQRRAEAELRAQEAMFHTLADAIPQLAWMTNAAGECTWFNRRWFDYTGATLDEMRGWGWRKVHHPEHVDRVVDAIRRCFERGEPWEDTFPLRSRDGTFRWFLSRAMPVRRDDGAVVGWFGTNTDITEHLEVEQKLRESEERLRRALEIETVGVLFFDTEGAVTYANDAFLEMAGLTRDDIAAGRVRWDGLYSPPAVEEFKVTGRTTPSEKEHVRKDGSRWWALFAAKRLNEREGVEFVVDISARKRAESELRHAVARAEAATLAKSRFLAATTHDLRQPLHLLVMAHDLLGQELHGGRARKALGRAERAAERITRAFDKLAEIARLESGVPVPQPQNVSLRPLLSEIEEICGPAAHRKGLGFVVLGRDEQVRSNPEMLRSIIENLVGNAIKYTEQGSVTVECLRRGNSLLVEVRDTGIGIPTEKLDDIFREYERLDPEKSEGMGLGLAIVTRSADLLGHRISVESEVGVGSCFRLELPVAEQPPRPSAE
jgi:PAS domain S-box-containing protein